MSNAALPGREDEPVEGYDDGLDIEVLRRRREIVVTVVALVIILGVAAFTAHKFLRAKPVTSAEVAAIAQQAVREAIPAGLTLQFGSPAETEISYPHDGAIEVAGHVVAVTREGGAQYYRFRCTLSEVESGRWRPTRLDLTPQP